MPTPSEAPASRRFAAQLSALYGEVMGVPPVRVETHVDGDVLTAVLFGASAPAEATLADRPDGCRMLRDYHAACAGELFRPVAGLTEALFGRKLVNVVLEAAPPSHHKLLVLVLAPGPEDANQPESNREGDER